MGRKLKLGPFVLGMFSLITIILSSVRIDLVAKQTTWGRTSISNLQVGISPKSVLSGVFATVLLTIGNVKKNPYLFLPWLILTMKNLMSFGGPSLLKLGYLVIPLEGFPGGVFFFACALLFMEELCVWWDILSICRWMWSMYIRRLVWENQKQEHGDTKASMKRLLMIVPKSFKQEDTYDITD